LGLAKTRAGSGDPWDVIQPSDVMVPALAHIEGRD